MAKTKLWNDNDHEHREKFKGAEVVIPAKGFIEMDFEEACELKGQFTPIVMLAEGVPDPKSFKKLRVEWPKEPTAKVDPLVCHADGSSAGSAQELAAKLLQFAPLLVKDEAAEAEARRKADAGEQRVAALEAQIAELKALIEGQAKTKARA